MSVAVDFGVTQVVDGNWWVDGIIEKWVLASDKGVGLMTRKLTIALLDEIQNSFNRHDVDANLSHFVEDCEWLMARGPNAPEGRRYVGKKEIGDGLTARYQEIPDMRWEEMRHWIVDQSKAHSEWVVRGTPKDGEPFEYVGCDLWEFRDDYVTKKDTYWRFVG